MPEISRFRVLVKLVARIAGRSAMAAVVAVVVAGTVLPVNVPTKHIQTIIQLEDGQGDSPLVP